MDTQETCFMEMALKEAKKAFAKNEVPIGCVLVLDGKVIAKAHNLVESKKQAWAHAELLCIQKASLKLGDFRLKGATLYCTLEPCLMCAGAIVLSRIQRVVYAAKDLRHGAIVSQLQLFSQPHPIHHPSFEPGPFEKESADLLKDFFKLQRKKNSGKSGTCAR